MQDSDGWCLFAKAMGQADQDAALGRRRRVRCEPRSKNTGSERKAGSRNSLKSESGEENAARGQDGSGGRELHLGWICFGMWSGEEMRKARSWGRRRGLPGRKAAWVEWVPWGSCTELSAENCVGVSRVASVGVEEGPCQAAWPRMM